MLVVQQPASTLLGALAVGFPPPPPHPLPVRSGERSRSLNSRSLNCSLRLPLQFFRTGSGNSKILTHIPIAWLQNAQKKKKTYNKRINKLPGKWPGWITGITEGSSLASETRVRPFPMCDGRDITCCEKQHVLWQISRFVRTHLHLRVHLQLSTVRDKSTP